MIQPRHGGSNAGLIQKSNRKQDQMGSSLVDDETGAIANRIHMDFSGNRGPNTQQKMNPFADSALGMSGDRTMLDGASY